MKLKELQNELKAVVKKDFMKLTESDKNMAAEYCQLCRELGAKKLTKGQLNLHGQLDELFDLNSNI